MKVFILDNYDSFTYNLVHYVEKYADSCIVRRNDEVIIDEIKQYDKIIFSPGPGLPSENPIMHQIIKNYKDSKAILGICLGHQSIAEYFGANLFNFENVVHGIEKNTRLVMYDKIFKNIPKEFISGRYHSWAVSEIDFPNTLNILAVDDDDVIMAIGHTKYPIIGLQFHPESIMTPYGKEIIKNWITE
ncbi:MAG: aminodeoxychorismate/anthranilate synthase component II [Bacteroidales bacterium]|jgi:anthranilate synthase component 2|nr:aminodeoxychorismate/anthranilate synthase component II [Bacteroidales bacterium]